MNTVRLRVACLVVMTPVALGAAEKDQVVQTAKVAPPTELKKSIVSELSDDAVQVADMLGNVWATFWFRKAIPSDAAPEQVKNGLTYKEVAPTTLIGVVQFHRAWSDFRKQEIAPGVYTLRLAVQPMDGDHQGTAPNNDFCLLVPANIDDGSGKLEVKALHELSAQASGSTHPAVMLLFPNDKPEETPQLVAKPGKLLALGVKRPVAAKGMMTHLGFSFVIVGHAQE